ncbi:MAG: proprotein convertase P-domain-containing protein [Phycisphaerales bacterium]|nr:proprotein convertase P-domain-containing protein [Phycisphaerales bacterium]
MRTAHSLAHAAFVVAFFGLIPLPARAIDLAELEKAWLQALAKDPQGEEALRAEIAYRAAHFRGRPSPERVIYGDDHRLEVWQVAGDAALTRYQRAAATVVSRSRLTQNGDGSWTLAGTPWTSQGGTICADEPFRGQPALGFCSAFLVGPDLIVTAGHCITSVSSMNSSAFVFDFEISSSGGSAPTVLPADRVYTGIQLVDRQQAGDLDHAVIRLDRPVSGRSPLPIRRTGSVSVGDPLVMIGYPAGLPEKVAAGAEVKNPNGGTAWFQANLDAYGGNSGSMVVNLNSGVIEGILVRGAPDYVTVGGCVRSNRVPDTGNTAGGAVFEEVSKTTGFAGSIPELGLQLSPSGDPLHLGPVGGPFQPASVVYTISNPTPSDATYQAYIAGGGSAPLLIEGGTSPVSGSVPAGGSASFTVSVAPGAAGLTQGAYTSILTFVDTTNSVQTIRNHVIEAGTTGVTLTPASGLTSGGPPGGPFPGSQAYTITSTRPSPVTIRVNAPGWVTLDGASPPLEFTLTGIGASRTVVAAFGGAAAGLPPGLATGQIDFVNLSGGSGGGSRPVSLDVGRASFAYSGPPVAIADLSTASAVVDVPLGFCVADMRVDLDLQHTYIGDLIVELTSPRGQTVRLHNRTGGSADDIIATFADGAPVGTRAPDGPGTLADFSAKLGSGRWTLTISDNAGGDTGTLRGFTLRPQIGPATCPPVADPQRLAVPHTVHTPVSLIGGAANPGPLSFIVTLLPSNGVLIDPAVGFVTSLPHTIAGGQSLVRYRPNSTFQGDDSFQFIVRAGGVDSAPATVSLTVGGPSVAYGFNMDTNPGWATDTGWAFGVPTGGGTTDPTSGATGQNVYGYNLAGNYENNITTTRYLTTTALNLTGRTGVRLQFRRWLGMESSQYDSANIQLSVDNGATWADVWNHNGPTFVDGTWTTQAYDLPAAANRSQVRIRWGLGPTDGSVVRCGWNIDDVEILASATAPPAPVPGSFVQTSPADGIAGQSLTPALAWAESLGADSYNVVVSASPALTPVVASATRYTNGWSVPSGLLAPNTSYYWRVTAVNPAGSTPSGGTFSFRTAGGAPPCPGDADGNGAVGAADLSIVLTSFGTCSGQPGYDPRADFDGNTCIGAADLSTILVNFGRTCP